jgi:SPP1 family predicted phage head-tail adaptor
MKTTGKTFVSALRHKVALERQALTADTAGGYEQTWVLVAHLWVSISRVRGGEAYVGGQLVENSTHIFRLRYNADIQADMRFIYDGRIFNIRSLDNVDERGLTLNVYVEEGVA